MIRTAVPSSRRRTRSGLWLVAALALSACDSTEIRPGVFDPFDTSRAYSVYAVLDATDTDHTIRVQTVRRESDPPMTEAEAVQQAPRVVTVDGATGDSLVWAQSVLQLSNGSFAALYTAQFEPGPSRAYDLVLTRSDGTDATARAIVPDGETAPLDAGSLERDGDVIARAQWAQFGAIRAAAATVAVRLDPGSGAPIFVPVAADFASAPSSEPIVEVNLSEAARQVAATFGLDASAPIYFADIRLEVTGTSPGWRAAGGDPVVAAEGGNIDGGIGRFGFVDSGIGFLTPPDEWVAQAGFTLVP